MHINDIINQYETAMKNCQNKGVSTKHDSVAWQPPNEREQKQLPNKSSFDV